MKPAISIALSESYPLLDPGTYMAVCTEASFEWAQQWNKWIARLVMHPEDYHGRPYNGRLCKFLGLGKNPQRPYAGPQSHFRRLLVEVNGDQPPKMETGVDLFVGVRYEIEVETVKADRHGKPLPGEHWYSVVRGIRPCRGSSGGKPSPTRQPLTLQHLNTGNTDNTQNRPTQQHH